jgi:hypothetical protein
MRVSPVRLWTTAAQTTYPGPSAAPLYLHLDENLSGSVRTGTISFINASGAEREIKITQLPAIPVGRFGNPYNPTNERIFTQQLYTEQLYEFKTMPYYSIPPDAMPNSNSVYNGTLMGFDNRYDNGYFNTPFLNYLDPNAKYQAMNYCAYKNRDASFGTPLANTDILWHLPSQSELMAMWITFETYKSLTTTNFFFPSGSAKGAPADAYWSATANPAFSNTDAQYVNFKYGLVGHNKKSQKMWVRCVRSRNESTLSMVSNTSGFATIDFTTSGTMPANSYTSTSKNTTASAADAHENNTANQTLYKKLRIANADADANPVNWTDAVNRCQNYNGSGYSSGWRLPTQRELQAIWLLQSEPNFTPTNTFSAYYYWTATSSYASGTLAGTDLYGQPVYNSPYNSAWMVWMSTVPAGDAGNTPNNTKVGDWARVRCVHEE